MLFDELVRLFRVRGAGDVVGGLVGIGLRFRRGHAVIKLAEQPGANVFLNLVRVKVDDLRGPERGLHRLGVNVDDEVLRQDQLRYVLFLQRVVIGFLERAADDGQDMNELVHVVLPAVHVVEDLP